MGAPDRQGALRKLDLVATRRWRLSDTRTRYFHPALFYPPVYASRLVEALNVEENSFQNFPAKGTNS